MACGASGVLSGSSGHSLGVLDAWEGTGLKDSSHPIPEFVAGSDAVEPALHARHDPFALGCQKVQDGVVVSPVQGCPDKRQILRRNRERVFVLIPAERRSAKAASRATPSHLPLGQVRPGSRLLETERKLLTHAIRMSAYNTESALVRLIRPHYSRGQDEAPALMREAFTLPGDLEITGSTLHVRLDPASAPRRSRALAALCAELTDTQTRYPGTDLTLAYSIKGHPTTA